MSLLTALYSRLSVDAGLSALVSTRIYVGVGPASATLPYVTHQLISAPREHSMAGAVGLVQSRVQFTVWAATALSAEAVADALRLALDDFKGLVGSFSIRGTFLESAADTFDQPVDGSQNVTHGKRLDFLIWFEET